MVEQVLYELILYGITIIQMLCVIELFLERMRITFIKVVYSAVILIGAYFILSYLNMQSIYAGVSGMVLGCILYKGKILHKSLCIFLGFGINLISELISHVFVDQVIKEIILSDKWENLILQLGSMTLTVTFVIILRNKDFLSKNKKEFGGASRREIITFNMLSFSSFGLIFLGVLSYLGYTKVVHNETLLLGIIGVTILLYLSLLSIIDYGARAEYYRRLNQVIENQLNQQLAYYERLEEVNQETRAIKHDIKNHMLVIGELLEAEEIDELKRYVVDITHSIVINKNVIQTGNSIADAVLNEKYWIACDNKINMTIDVQLTKHMKIASVDLCTILANSIDNAIEEENQYKKGIIKLKEELSSVT